MSLAVVILAGGEGSRLGGNKPLRELGGKSLIEIAAAHASGWSEHVAVAAREREQMGTVDLPFLADAEGVRGPLAGLIAARRFAEDRGCSFMQTIPTDMPFLPPDLPERLAAALSGYGVALPQSGGSLHPDCALWSVEALEGLDGYAAEGRRSLIGLAEQVGFATDAWACEPVDPFFNINSAGDLAEAERISFRLGEGG